jgi:U32 family peptidase
MSDKFELLAPGGDLNSIKAAILAGADAVYCGLQKFNARNRAANITIEDLAGILNLAQKFNCKIFLTLNIIILENEIPPLLNLLNELVNTKIHGIIIQDIGLFYLLKNHFKTLKIHASTQCTTHNKGQIKFLKKLSACRVNLSRELNIQEIADLTAWAHENNILTEVFVHGSYCISFSGICYFSSVSQGKSGNRGRCSQPCRDRYSTTPTQNNYPFNLKDNSAYFDLKSLSKAGVDSLKIEGRIKKSHYVYTIVKSYKEQIEHFQNSNELLTDDSDLFMVFNRDFSNSYLKGDINREMFIDNPRDNSIQHFSKKQNHLSDTELELFKKNLYNQKETNAKNVETLLKKITISKTPLTLTLSGEVNNPLKIVVTTPDNSFVLLSKINLTNSDKHILNDKSIMKRFKVLNNREFLLQNLELENLQNNLYIPFKELNSMKNRIMFLLNGSKEIIPPVKLPSPHKEINAKAKTDPVLSILISSKEDLHLCNSFSGDIYYKIPNGLLSKYSNLIEIFGDNKNLLPWFPPVLIGENYQSAVNFLQKVKPKKIITNNTGIAQAAYDNNIPWIAGPYLNISNSLALKCLKDDFNCSGAFISNELNQNQIRKITPFDDFKLIYSIYHPIVLLTSRQCLFHQISGCEKPQIDGQCIEKCNRNSIIINQDKTPLFVDKQKGNYHQIFNNQNFLNLDIINTLPGHFSEFLIDFSNIKTETSLKTSKSQIINLFEESLRGNQSSISTIKENIHPTTKAQYIKGL